MAFKFASALERIMTNEGAAAWCASSTIIAFRVSASNFAMRSGWSRVWYVATVLNQILVDSE